MKEKFNLSAMIVDLTSLENSVLEFNFALSPESIDLEVEGAALKNAVKVKGKLTKGIAQIDVAGEISADAMIECARCLQPIERKLEIPFKAEFVSAENYTVAKEAKLRGNDLDVSVFEDNKIDLTELVREQILLNLSEQIFCREDCRGLCDKCGANRNLVDCNCIKKEVDPRWAALKNLK
ncbi:MAG: YceD family protein [Pyrinomonadaceae bacterium]